MSADPEKAGKAAEPWWHAISPEWRGKLKRAGMAASVAFVTVLVGDFMRGEKPQHGGHRKEGEGHASRHDKHGSHAERHRHGRANGHWGRE